MAKIYDTADAVKNFAQSLIPSHHPELASARIGYLFTDSTSRKGGRELLGKATKVSGRWEHLTELDFIIEVAAPSWNDLQEHQRQALVDHLLEHCSGEEDEKTGEMKWSIREPDVQEFSSILQRHQIWNESLKGFIRVAQEIDLTAILAEEMESDEETEEEVDLNEDEEIDLSEV